MSRCNFCVCVWFNQFSMNLIKSVFVIVSSVLVLSSYVEGENLYQTLALGPTCKVEYPTSMPTDWITMVHSCTALMMKQVQTELRASLTYLSMGAHFSRDCVNRPGFAKFFFESANEERQHAMKFIEYLSMRGNLTAYHDHVLSLIPDSVMDNIPTTWDSAVHALESALKLETSVTESIRQIIIECEAGKNENTDITTVNDYHLADWLTGEFLEEQYKGQRQLAGMLSTMSKMNPGHAQLSEFMYDKTLL